MIRPDALYSRIKKRHAGLHPEPMFDVTEQAAPEPKPRRKPPAERKHCPLCRQLVGLDADRRPGLQLVLVWRLHHRTTEGGSTFVCRTSGTDYQPPTPTTGDRP